MNNVSPLATLFSVTDDIPGAEKSALRVNNDCTLRAAQQKTTGILKNFTDSASDARVYVNGAPEDDAGMAFSASETWKSLLVRRSTKSRGYAPTEPYSKTFFLRRHQGPSGSPNQLGICATKQMPIQNR